MSNGMRAYPLRRERRELGAYLECIALDHGMDSESSDRMTKAIDEDGFTRTEVRRHDRLAALTLLAGYLACY